jgi:hypothetical protein
MQLVVFHKPLKHFFIYETMENKHVGYLLFGVSVLIIGIIFMFKRALLSFVDASCTIAHGGEYCPMYDTITQQTYLALGIVSVLVLTSLILMFSRQTERIIIKHAPTPKSTHTLDTSTLTPDERRVVKLIVEKKALFQADLIEATGLHKAKVTRILDRLEGKGIVERKRRGMTNVVVLQHP